MKILQFLLLLWSHIWVLRFILFAFSKKIAGFGCRKRKPKKLLSQCWDVLIKLAGEINLGIYARNRRCGVQMNAPVMKKQVLQPALLPIAKLVTHSTFYLQHLFYSLIEFEWREFMVCFAYDPYFMCPCSSVVLNPFACFVRKARFIIRTGIVFIMVFLLLCIYFGNVT